MARSGAAEQLGSRQESLEAYQKAFDLLSELAEASPGDFETERLLAHLQKTISAWRSREPTKKPTPASSITRPFAGRSGCWPAPRRASAGGVGSFAVQSGALATRARPAIERGQLV